MEHKTNDITIRLDRNRRLDNLNVTNVESMVIMLETADQQGTSSSQDKLIIQRVVRSVYISPYFLFV